MPVNFHHGRAKISGTVETALRQGARDHCRLHLPSPRQVEIRFCGNSCEPKRRCIIGISRDLARQFFELRIKLDGGDGFCQSVAMRVRAGSPLSRRRSRSRIAPVSGNLPFARHTQYSGQPQRLTRDRSFAEVASQILCDAVQRSEGCSRERPQKQLAICLFDIVHPRLSATSARIRQMRTAAVVNARTNWVVPCH
jgi:hypothetical protein